MALIRVSTVIEADQAKVWDTVRHIQNHTDWMADATAIRFLTDQTTGVGTTFECDTKVGPAKLTDVMEITEWEDEKIMGVKHTGIVTGSGAFHLTAAGPNRTEFRWEEELIFPFWMGGPLRDPVGGRIMEWIWKRNLKTLKTIVESS